MFVFVVPLASNSGTSPRKVYIYLLFLILEFAPYGYIKRAISWEIVSKQFCYLKSEAIMVIITDQLFREHPFNLKGLGLWLFGEKQFVGKCDRFVYEMGRTSILL